MLNGNNEQNDTTKDHEDSEKYRNWSILIFQRTVFAVCGRTQKINPDQQ